MRIYLFPFFIAIVILGGCIGDDFVDDFVEPEIRFIDFIDTLAVGDTYQLSATFFNNVGLQDTSQVLWSSSDDNIALISEDGLLWGRTKGEVTIVATVNYNNEILTESRNVVIDEETVEIPVLTTRTASLMSTSTYALQGNVDLTIAENGLVLNVKDDFKTDDVLPGLYVYLSNNPSTINGALEIAEVTVFEGEHSFEITGDVKLTDYNYVLYFCKPFNVKVGDGELSN